TVGGIEQRDRDVRGAAWVRQAGQTGLAHEPPVVRRPYVEGDQMPLDDGLPDALPVLARQRRLVDGRCARALERGEHADPRIVVEVPPIEELLAVRSGESHHRAPDEPRGHPPHGGNIAYWNG